MTSERDHVQGMVVRASHQWKIWWQSRFHGFPRASPAFAGVTFDLNASTTVSFSGDVHLHAWLAHQFSGVAPWCGRLNGLNRGGPLLVDRYTIMNRGVNRQGMEIYDIVGIHLTKNN